MISPTEASQPPAPGRPRRLGLYGPFVALAIALLVWGGVWLWMKHQVEQRLDAAAARMAAAGGVLAWSARTISGYPFRLDAVFTGLVWRGPHGWGASFPELKTETSVFALGHWVAYAPAGASLLRPQGGEVRIAARVLRASLSQTSAHPPSLSLEGQGLTFTPAPGAAPYVLASAAELHLHTRAGPANQGALLIVVDAAKAAGDSKLAALTGDGAVTLSLDALFNHADALSGPGWTSAARAWADAGGRLQVRRLRFQAGAFVIDGRGDGLTLAPDGRLAGTLEVTASGLRQSAGLGPLNFADGRLRFESIDLGPSPRIY